jgi:hypothetical protein
MKVRNHLKLSLYPRHVQANIKHFLKNKKERKTNYYPQIKCHFSPILNNSIKITTDSVSELV